MLHYFQADPVSPVTLRQLMSHALHFLHPMAAETALAMQGEGSLEITRSLRRLSVLPTLLRYLDLKYESVLQFF